MVKIRELFHKIGNLHNKICVAAGVSKAELGKKTRKNSSHQETEKIVARLSEVEQTVVEASRDLRQLKDMVYSIIDSDTEKIKR